MTHLPKASVPKTHHPYVALATRAIAHAVKTNTPYRVTNADFNEVSCAPSPVFVSIKKAGHLRGCIGIIEVFTTSLAAMIAHCACAAALHDPRFMPLTVHELSLITVSVDVLKDFESIDTVAMLNPKHYGVLVTANDKQGLLLPAIEGIDTPSQQRHIAMEKAGIKADEVVKMQRFRVDRYASDHSE